MTKEEQEEAWQKWKEEFPKLPFPRNFENSEVFGADWKMHLLDVYSEEIWDNSVNIPVIMEQYCWFVANKKPIPQELSYWVAHAFKDYLKNDKSLEQGFRIKKDDAGKKIKRDYDGSPFPRCLGHLMWAVVFEGNPLVDAKKLIQKEDKVSKSTLNDYVDNPRLVEMALFNVIMSIEVLEYRHLNKDEIERLKIFMPEYNYVALNSKESLAKQKIEDEENSKKQEKEDRKNRLIKQWKLDEL